ncbi:uncharacterized protein LOC118467557 [Anopheles albimanus]|uniref:uncharacterized protein LOC118467557 n=1 Tax=Anopheles albimanus TaxID=7167 RepID=UPI0016402B49|nr:uncharacterized protein LOC118467557 [Anopheles albimanus]
MMSQSTGRMYLLLIVLAVVSFRSVTIAKMVPIIKSINYAIKCPHLNGIFELHTETASRIRYSTVSFSFTILRPIHIITVRSIAELLVRLTNKKQSFNKCSPFISPQLRIAVWISSRGSHLYPIYNTTLPFCEFLRRPESHRLVRIVYNEVRRYGSVPNRCPINPGTYAFNNITLKQLDFPSFLVETEYVLDMSGLFGSKMEHCVEIRVKGTLKKFNAS